MSVEYTLSPGEPIDRGTLLGCFQDAWNTGVLPAVIGKKTRRNIRVCRVMLEDITLVVSLNVVVKKARRQNAKASND